MKTFYDKLILLVGALALAAGVGYYFIEKDKGVEKSNVLTDQPFGPEYQPISLPQVPSSRSAWPDPSPQDAAGLEAYDVFTPPKIYWDGSQFIFEPPKPPEEIIPFGLALQAFEQELYRIQMEAFVGQGKTAQAQIFDTVTNQKYRGSVGETFEEIDTQIVAIENKLVTNPDGTVRRIPKVTLLDGGSGKEITLTTDERRYIPDEYKIRFVTLFPYPREEFLWEEVGETYDIGNVTFKLLDFDFDKQSATVEKTSPDLETPEQKTLIVSPSPAAMASGDLETTDRTGSSPPPKDNPGAREFSDLFDSSN